MYICNMMQWWYRNLFLDGEEYDDMTEEVGDTAALLNYILLCTASMHA